MAGMDRFPQEECADTIIPPPPPPTAPSQEEEGATFNGMTVYNPVDESFEGWPSGREQNAGAINDTFDEDDINVLPNDSNLENNNIDDDGFDMNNPEVIAAQEQQLSQYYDANNAKGGVDTSMDDDALAQAIAEQDLPPGVSAAEQQEIMMRLLTQQLRRGDWGTNDDGNGENGNTTELSPALEQRLRDFQFAQKKRREKYGNERPWGILGLYDHLGKLCWLHYCLFGRVRLLCTHPSTSSFRLHITAGIRLDVEWAEDAAWRRTHKEPYLSWSDFQTTRDVGWNRPFFTYILLVVCTAVLIASYGLNGWKVEPLSINPMIGPSAETLIKMGAKQTSLIVNQNEWYRLFSPMVLHAGLIHYFLNMTALWFIGKAVEQCHGFAAAAILFIIPAVGGTILSAIFLPEYISVGASGGIFGLIGACIADICINWSLLFSKHVNTSDEGARFRHLKVSRHKFLSLCLQLLHTFLMYIQSIPKRYCFGCCLTL